MTLSDVFAQGGTEDRVGKILVLVERLQKIEAAISTIKYDNDLFTEVPEVLRTLGNAKDAVTAELKII